MIVRSLLAINQHLYIACSIPDCRHRVRWSAIEACQRLGPDTNTEVVKRRMVCGACGAKGSHGHLSIWPCTLDTSAAHAWDDFAKGKVRGLGTPEETLARTLANLQKLVGEGNKLGGDGAVQWPVDGSSKGG